MINIQKYVERESWLVDRCRGKRVLHLGCVGFTDCPVPEKVRLAGHTLHQKLSAVCDCVGIDLDRTTVEQLQQAGVFRNVRVGDAERLEEFVDVLLPFDLVVAGDIIEHLSNPGRMLDGARKLLKPDGSLMVSTPNSFGLPAFLRHLFGTFREGQQHVLCFNYITLAQMLERHGYQVTEAHTCHQQTARGSHPLAFKLGIVLFRMFPRFGGTLQFVAQVGQS